MKINKSKTSRYYALLLFLLVCIISPVAAATAGTDYYVDPVNGNDTNTGTSQKEAWKTIEKINTTSFREGDCIYLAGGKTLAGTLTFDSNDTGVKENPIIISSYGIGRAVINGGDISGIIVNGTKGITVTKVNIIGSGYKSGNKSGINLVDANDVILDSIDVSGFQAGGILTSKSSNLKISNVYSHENGFAGIACNGGTNIYIGYCRTINNPGFPTSRNHSGNGIVVGSGVSYCTIEYCESAYNGWDMPARENGPVGIWCYMADHVIIQYNISHDNKSPTKDGGGFDFDGGTTNSILQYNYSYDNNGTGYLFCSFDKDLWNSNNIMRYNISDNDGTGTQNSGIFIWLGESQKDFQIYNNVIYNKNGRNCVSGEMPESFYFRNNIFILRGDGKFVDNVKNATFQNNLYWNYDSPGNWDGVTSLDEWRKKSGNEVLDGRSVGFNVDPQIIDPGRAEKITDPRKIRQLQAYILKELSPAINSGLDLKKQFQIDPGTHDFFGNKIPNGSGIDIGIHELNKK